METWSGLCRCCLSANTKISILDTEENIKTKFLETTSIEVKQNDGLPNKLCETCLSLMNSAYVFKQQCMKMDQDLKQQLESMLAKAKAIMATSKENITYPIKCDISCQTGDPPDKHLESTIKQQHIDSDDECYYVLVIDEPKENEMETITPDLPPLDFPNLDLFNIKIEEFGETLNETNTKEPEEPDLQTKEIEQKLEEQSKHSFGNTMDSYLVSTDKIPDSVPATILENEEESTVDNEEFSQIMNEYSQSNNTVNTIVKSDDIANANCEGDDNADSNNGQSDTNNLLVTQIDSASDIIGQDFTDMTNTKNLIKILTAAGPDGTIVLKTADNIEYLSAATLGANVGGHPLDPQVIYCEGEESQFQILKCDGSELVIEYADGSEIATILQQADGSFLCDCGERFMDMNDYEKHQHKHNPAGDHLCNLCGKGFESVEILTGHMLLHKASGQLLPCPYCDHVVKRNSITQHIKYNHNNIKPRCTICSKTFANPNNLKRHMMIHKGIKEFQCDICSKRFLQKITMQTHRLTHMNPACCKECGENFDNAAGLLKHKESGLCTKSKLLKVKEEYMKNIKQEITASIGGKLLGYACSLCKKIFSLESALEQHVNTEHIIDPADLLCSDCGDVFTTKKEMQTHMTSHKSLKSKNAKRFECSTCNKGCSSQAMLVMHERVHTNERPFPCHLCALRFKTKTHLRTHQLTHTREKRFGCSVCMKFFALKGNLVVHLRTHTGERPYVCSLCGDAFIDSKYLKKHKLKKHDIGNLPWDKY
ncbi:hypothetical protein ACJJTC_015943 [Scirpophaga incertulas]